MPHEGPGAWRGDDDEVRGIVLDHDAPAVLEQDGGAVMRLHDVHHRLDLAVVHNGVGVDLQRALGPVLLDPRPFVPGTLQGTGPSVSMMVRHRAPRK